MNDTAETIAAAVNLFVDLLTVVAWVATAAIGAGLLTGAL